MEPRRRYDRQGHGRRYPSSPQARLAAMQRRAAGPNSTAAIYVNAHDSDGSSVEVWDAGTNVAQSWIDSGKLNFNVTDISGRQHGYSVDLSDGSLRRYL
jgi:hypothetical protein